MFGYDRARHHGDAGPGSGVDQAAPLVTVSSTSVTLSPGGRAASSGVWSSDDWRRLDTTTATTMTITATIAMTARHTPEADGPTEKATIAGEISSDTRFITLIS